MIRKVSENFYRIRELVESGDVVISLYIEEEDRPGQRESDLKVYLATSLQAEILKDALCEQREKGDLKFNSITIRPRRDVGDLQTGSVVAIVRI